MIKATYEILGFDHLTEDLSRRKLEEFILSANGLLQFQITMRDFNVVRNAIDSINPRT